MATRTWIDLDKHNAALTLVKLKGKQIAVINGDLNTDQMKALTSDLGFKSIRSPSSVKIMATTRFTNREGKINLAAIPFEAIQTIFPDSEIRELDVKSIFSFWQGYSLSSQKSIYLSATSERCRRALDAYESIGINEHGIEIYLSNSEERFYKHDDKHMFAPNTGMHEYLAYDLQTRSHRIAAAKGLLNELNAGRTVDGNRLDEIVETSEVKLRLTSDQAKNTQAQITSLMTGLLNADNRKAYDKQVVDLELLQTLNDNLTVIPLANRANQIRTNLSTGYAYLTRKYLEAVDNCENLTVVNDAAMGAITLTPSELPIRVLTTNQNSSNLVTYEEAFGAVPTQLAPLDRSLRAQGKQFVFAGTLGELDSPAEVSGITTNRLDHYELLCLLNGMSEDASGLFVIGTDDSYDLGNVNMDSSPLHSHVFQNYNVVDCFDVAPIILGDHAESSARRVYIINGRRPVPSTSNAPTAINALFTIHDVYQYGNGLVERFGTELAKVDLTQDELLSTSSMSDILASYTANQTEAAKYDLNFAQAPYTPLTSLARANDTAALPRNFVHASREAAIKLVRSVGNPDKFLMNEMGLTAEQINDAWDAEQIDALTMGIWRLKNNKPFLEGDATGKGKGRVLAGLLYWQIKHHDKAVFLTSNNDLLNDIWRDIRHCNLDAYMDPLFIMGDDSAIVDKDENIVLFDSKSLKDTREQIVNGNIFKPNQNLILSTYPQLNRLDPPSRTRKTIESRLKPKAKWLTQFVRENNPLIVADESHNVASTTSNQAAVIDLVFAQSTRPKVRSSATWSKDGNNIAQCADLFPSDITPDVLKKMVSQGGTGLQEVLATVLKSEGAMVRREHNFGKRNVEVVTSKQHQRNKDATDVLAEIMTATRDYTRKQFDVIKLNRAINPHNNIEEYSFASTFGIISEGFTNALKADTIVEEVTADIELKRKPIIGVDKTAETALRFLFDNLKQADEERVIVEEFPDFKTTLARWLQNEGSRRVTITHLPTPQEVALANAENRLPKGEREMLRVSWRQELSPTSATYIELDQMEKDIQKLILKMPDLPLSPMDYVKDRCAQQDITFSEVSGRSLHVRRHEDGVRFVIEKRPQESKSDAQYNFNSNTTDAIMVTKSGVEGISLHAHKGLSDKHGEEAANTRAVTLFGQFFYIIDEEQFFGRGERKGPGAKNAVFKKVVTGVPIEARMLAISERNRLKLSASTTGNSKSLRATNTIPNFLNNFGNEVVAQYLNDNPSVMNSLGFEEHVQNAILDWGSQAKRTNQISSLAGSVLGKMMLLSFDQQEDLLDDLTQYYRTKLSTLQSKGLDPLNTHVINGEVEVSNELVLKGKIQPFYASEFDKPVIAQDIRIEHPPTKIDPEVIGHNITRGKKALDARLGRQNASLASLATFVASKRAEILTRTLHEYNNRAFLGTRNQEQYFSVSDALKSDVSNPVKTAQRDFNEIVTMLNAIELGHVYRVSDNAKSYVIEGIFIPPKDEDLLSAWRYDIVFTSTSGSVSSTMSLDSFKFALGDPEALKAMHTGEFNDNHPVNDEFRALRLKGPIEYASILVGNVIEAAKMNAEKNLGSQVVVKNAATGAFYPAVRLKRNIRARDLTLMNFDADEKVNEVFVEYAKENLAADKLVVFEHRTSKPEDGLTKQGTIQVASNNLTFSVTLPKTKAGRYGLYGQDPFEGLHIATDKVNKRTLIPTKFIFNMNDLDSVLDTLKEHNFSLQLSTQFIDMMESSLSKAKISSPVDLDDQTQIEQDIIKQENVDAGKDGHNIPTPQPDSESEKDSDLLDEMIQHVEAQQSKQQAEPVVEQQLDIEEAIEIEQEHSQTNSHSLMSEMGMDDQALSDDELQAMFNGQSMTP
ncbi:strawberry notch-like NTP hydrolase domain-containing protein [Vibrio mediterranei]|uniref:strawberry notch-like NTP hydrolase domain-containing protein n=1 Tax=Vibrio mediterranei TaxID=689 RepID=UPI0038CE8F09